MSRCRNMVPLHSHFHPGSGVNPKNPRSHGWCRSWWNSLQGTRSSLSLLLKIGQPHVHLSTLAYWLLLHWRTEWRRFREGGLQIEIMWKMFSYTSEKRNPKTNRWIRGDRCDGERRAIKREMKRETLCWEEGHLAVDKYLYEETSFKVNLVLGKELKMGRRDPSFLLRQLLSSHAHSSKPCDFQRHHL